MTGPQRSLNDRYEVGELIGRGGMADVYQGRDLRLGRRVAIKLMRPDLARDPQFQSRFRREAHSSAALNHPHIVSVFDTGDVELEDTAHHGVSCPYLVMEFVDGKTLRELMHREEVDVDSAARWMAGVLDALDYSHRQGIVHRDIKPANIMVTSHEAVKVMDFGIARALSDSSATMTQTQAVVGTALYLAPEQARGDRVDARSDLYAAGCVLFELLTGRPPFVGDSPVAVAYQHVREEPVRPSTINSLVTPSLDLVVAKALSKDPDQRYQTGAEFAEALQRAADGLDPHPLAVPTSHHHRPDDDATAALPPIAPLAASAGAAGISAQQDPYPDPPTQVFAGPGTPDDTTPPPRLPTGRQSVVPPPLEYRDPRSPATNQTQTALADLEEDEDPREPRRRGGAAKAVIGVLVVLLAIGAVIGGWFLIQEMNRRSAEANQVAIPDVRDLTQIEAQNLLTQADLRPILATVHDDEVDRDRAVGTDPAAGTEVPRGREVTLQISSGPEQVTIPENLAGQSEATVRDTLEELGLNISSVRDVESSTIPRDRLVNTSPALGSTVRSGSPVELQMSNGMVEVPSLAGMGEDQARTTLHDVGLRLTVVNVSTSSVAPGIFIDQDPQPGDRVPQNSSVTARFAQAPEITPSPTPTESESESASPSPSPTESSPTAEPSEETSPSEEPSPTDDPTASEEPSPTEEQSPTEDPSTSAEPDPIPSDEPSIPEPPTD